MKDVAFNVIGTKSRAKMSVKMNKVTILAVLLVSSLLTSSVSFAQTSGFEKCKAIEDSEKRLSCFDALSATQESKAPIAPEKPDDTNAVPEQELDDIEKRAQALMKNSNNDNPFSSSAPRLGANNNATRTDVDSFGKPKNENLAQDTYRTNSSNEIEQIQTSITSLKENSRGFYTFTLNNGQVWRQTEVSNGSYKKGDIVEIEKGVFSSYYINKLESNRTTRVKRLK